MAQVKICGINTEAALLAAAEAGADWVGFNFFPRSPRFVTPERAAALCAVMTDAAGGGPTRVGLFVDPEDAVLAAALGAVRLDALQVYAPVARVREIGARFGVPVWLPCGVGAREELPREAAGVARLLIEAKAPVGATRPGGNAVAFDWSVTQGWASPAPWMLAGGLTVENVGRAIAQSGAVAVDVASGVERAPGVKDAGLMRAFVQAARADALASVITP